MATVTLSEVYEPTTFDQLTNETAIELNAYINSGVMTEYPLLTTMANQGGKVGEMPFYTPISTAAEPNHTNDDNTDTSTPKNMTKGLQTWRLAKLHDSWSTMDFARELALADPLTAIASQVNKFWAIQTEKRLIQTTIGILADNVANDSGDMVNDIYSDIATPADANIISAEAILDAKQTAGDHQAMFTNIAMHSVTFNNLLKQNLIDYIPNSVGVVNIATYLGLTVTVDDSLPVVAGSNSSSYTTVMFAQGAFGFGNGRALVPSEMERIAGSGNGGGEDIIHSRINPIIHPQGFACTGTPADAEALTWAELAAAATWNRVASDRKNVGMAFLTHNN